MMTVVEALGKTMNRNKLPSDVECFKKRVCSYQGVSQEMLTKVLRKNKISPADHTTKMDKVQALLDKCLEG